MNSAMKLVQFKTPVEHCSQMLVIPYSNLINGRLFISVVIIQANLQFPVIGMPDISKITDDPATMF
jgi:hypothetical protein